MYARMRVDPRSWPHSAVAHMDDPVEGSWVSTVQGFLHKFDIHPFVHDSSRTLAQLRFDIKRYRVMEVEPKLGLEPCRPLPWCWLASSSHTAFCPEAFECWWSFRILGKPSRLAHTKCALCHSDTLPDSLHLLFHCSAFRAIAVSQGFKVEHALDFPACPATFDCILRGFAGVALAFSDSSRR